MSAADPANLGRYQLSLSGLGQDASGKLDPAQDKRNQGIVFETVDLKIDRLGWYRFDLYHAFRDGRITVEDQNGKVVASYGEPGTPQQFQTLLGPGSYRVVVGDNGNGGDWRLITTMTFEGAGS